MSKMHFHLACALQMDSLRRRSIIREAGEEQGHFFKQGWRVAARLQPVIPQFSQSKHGVELSPEPVHSLQVSDEGSDSVTAVSSAPPSRPLNHHVNPTINSTLSYSYIYVRTSSAAAHAGFWSCFKKSFIFQSLHNRNSLSSLSCFDWGTLRHFLSTR